MVAVPGFTSLPSQSPAPSTTAGSAPAAPARAIRTNPSVSAPSSENPNAQHVRCSSHAVHHSRKSAVACAAASDGSAHSSPTSSPITRIRIPPSPAIMALLPLWEKVSRVSVSDEGCQRRRSKITRHVSRAAPSG